MAETKLPLLHPDTCSAVCSHEAWILLFSEVPQQSEALLWCLPQRGQVTLTQSIELEGRDEHCIPRYCNTLKRAGFMRQDTGHVSCLPSGSCEASICATGLKAGVRLTRAVPGF